MRNSPGPQMRRIIAEDPEWNLATVPNLTELCLKHIIDNFGEKPLLEELLPQDRSHVLKNLPVEIPLSTTANLIGDDNYWKRCCKTRWKICDVSCYGNCWRRMFFEKNLEEIIEKYVPGVTDQKQVLDTLQLSGQFVVSLKINNLLPPIKEPQKNEDSEFSDSESDAGEEIDIDHFDFNVAIPFLPNLEELHICYGVRDCGMNFEWDLFEFTNRDCSLLAKAVKSCPKIRLFHLHRSKVNDEKARVLISHLLDHTALTILDLSYNKLGNSSARALGKLLNNHSALHTLSLIDNQIGAQGAAALAHALGKNSTLKNLNLRLNRLEDDGCQSMLRVLLKNNTLELLHLGSNNVTHKSAPLLAQVLVYNKTLKILNLSCNKFAEEGGKTIQEGMEDNSTIVQMDMRMTEIGQECEYCISQLLKKNREAARKK